MFANDDEALAAAIDAYAAYEEVATLIFSEGGANADRLRTVATGDLLEVELDGYQRVQARGQRLTGSFKFDKVVLQRVDEQAIGGVGVVVVYLCEILTGTDVLDASGASTVKPGRPDRTPFEVSFDWNAEGNSLLVGHSDIWMGGGVC
ncbi:hypothetical protein E3T55_05230 [Cryobacterium frigoriphilum]|uniref:Nuclear transport factor 2 family protein n=1 Tax=Cryobacterium frigoriphilum TaxID=1259150 RepID=A0A4R9A7R0_9MICO|nr:hypothetical protein [Cryobacterium frigoriphilum]TFD53525.1 hypothetical protein E3T55_05230 [Cryobacterium frigoriphilum]